MLKYAKHLVRSFCMDKSYLFYPLYGLKEKNRELFITRESDIVIEGYPRSGNTFSYFAFTGVQDGECSVAHHLHVPVQLLRALAWGIPAVVLIRNPIDAISSLVMRYPVVHINQCFKDYIRFYGVLAEHRHRFVISDFETTVSCFGDAISGVNEKYGTQFTPFEHTPENVEAVFASIREMHKNANRGRNQIAIPTEDKQKLKESFRKRVLDTVDGTLKSESQALYHAYTGK